MIPMILNRLTMNSLLFKRYANLVNAIDNEISLDLVTIRTIFQENIYKQK